MKVKKYINLVKHDNNSVYCYLPKIVKDKFYGKEVVIKEFETGLKIRESLLEDMKTHRVNPKTGFVSYKPFNGIESMLGYYTFEIEDDYLIMTKFNGQQDE